jgi:hypothetical protein
MPIPSGTGNSVAPQRHNTPTPPDWQVLVAAYLPLGLYCGLGVTVRAASWESRRAVMTRTKRRT